MRSEDVLTIAGAAVAAWFFARWWSGRNQQGRLMYARAQPITGSYLPWLGATGSAEKNYVSQPAVMDFGGTRYYKQADGSYVDGASVDWEH